MKFHVTYETITDESAENGEVETSGFVAQDVSLRDALSYIEQTIYNYEVIEGSAYPLRHARWFTFYGSRDIRTGEFVNCSLHPARELSQASTVRLAKLIGAYGANRA